MSTWVDLGDLYVKKAGDSVSGSILMANNNLSVAYDSDTTYNVGTEIKSLRDSVSSINTNWQKGDSGYATLTDQCNSGWCDWKRSGKICVFHYYLILKYAQSTWDESPSLVIHMPVPILDDTKASTCGLCSIGLPDEGGIVMMRIDSNASLKLVRRANSVSAGKPIEGWGMYICDPTAIGS